MVKYISPKDLADYIHDGPDLLVFDESVRSRFLLRNVAENPDYRGKHYAFFSREMKKHAKDYGIDPKKIADLEKDVLGNKYGYTFIGGADQFDKERFIITGGKRTVPDNHDWSFRTEKEVAQNALNYMVLATRSAEVEYLGEHGFKLPIEVEPGHEKDVRLELARVLYPGEGHGLTDEYVLDSYIENGIMPFDYSVRISSKTGKPVVVRDILQKFKILNEEIEPDKLRYVLRPKEKPISIKSHPRYNIVDVSIDGRNWRRLLPMLETDIERIEYVNSSGLFAHRRPDTIVTPSGRKKNSERIRLLDNSRWHKYKNMEDMIEKMDESIDKEL